MINYLQKHQQVRSFRSFHRKKTRTKTHRWRETRASRWTLPPPLWTCRRTSTSPHCRAEPRSPRPVPISARRPVHFGQAVIWTARRTEGHERNGTSGCCEDLPAQHKSAKKHRGGGNYAGGVTWEGGREGEGGGQGGRGRGEGDDTRWGGEGRRGEGRAHGIVSYLIPNGRPDEIIFIQNKMNEMSLFLVDFSRCVAWDGFDFEREWDREGGRASGREGGIEREKARGRGRGWGWCCWARGALITAGKLRIALVYKQLMDHIVLGLCRCDGNAFVYSYTKCRWCYPVPHRARVYLINNVITSRSCCCSMVVVVGEHCTYEEEEGGGQEVWLCDLPVV